MTAEAAFVHVKDVATVIRKSRQTTTAMARDGRLESELGLPVIRIAGEWHVWKSDLDALVNRARTVSTEGDNA